MTSYVLCHGGGMGGWVWRDVARGLREAGHEVRTPTFTGFGEREHLLDRSVVPQTHVDDIVNMLRYEDLADVVIVAHSYAGSVIPGVVAAVPERIRRLVYLDAIVANAGEPVAAAMGMMTEEQCAGVSAAVAAGDMPPHSGVHLQQREMAKTHPFRMSAERQEWLLAHLSDMPVASVANPVVAPASSLALPVDYIWVTDTIMTPMHERARALGWTMHELHGDHAVLVGEPEKVVELLLRI